jgi:uncharacterized OsmC-like protein
MTGLPADLREYDVRAVSTAVLGRVMCSARNHHIIVDGPEQNGFPGEEITPAELFLQSVAACGVELVQMLAVRDEIAVGDIDVKIHGILDRANPVREDYTVFNRVEVECRLTGVSQEQAEQLVEGFTRRCPLFGSMKVASGEVVVSVVRGV